jgi:hypothetical protein
MGELGRIGSGTGDVSINNNNNSVMIKIINEED